MRAAPLVRVVRSNLEESLHLGHVAVCDADGRVLWRAGDPSRPVFSRSCTKPLQAAVSLSAIGEVALTDREIAVMCSSHNGEPIHLGAVRSLLDRASLGPEALQTPPSYPMDPDAMSRSQHPNPMFHACSGKHAGMVLACVQAGWDPSTYLSGSSALQRRIKKAVVSATGVARPSIGVDGCGAPVFGVPLRAMATLYARFAALDRLDPLAAETGRAIASMLAEPFLVGGSKRLDTDLMTVADGIVAKEGAEGLFCATVIPEGIGIAVKVQDGGDRACEPALLAVLQQLGAITPEQVRQLGDHARVPVMGGASRVGSIEPVVTLHRR